MVQIAVAADVPYEERKDPTREGLIKRKWLLRGGEADGLNFRLFRSEYQEGELAFQSPRHHHAFQQFRWAERGEINFAPDQYIPKGDIAYFPRGTYYGPQVKDTGVSWLLQFGFGPELPGGKQAMELHRAAVEQLRDRGRIEDGMFIDIDPETGKERRRNPAEVLVEEQTGKPYRIPDEGYAAPILMHSKAFAFADAAPGIGIKRLGAFFDHAGPDADVRVRILRFESGAEYRLSGERAQIGWSVGDGVTIDGEEYPALTAFFSPRDEDTALSGKGGAEVYIIDFPRLD